MRGIEVLHSKIQSVLFCCNYNSVRSPMAEGIFKKHVGKNIFVQSAGIYDNLEIDGFTVKVCDEIDVKLNRHSVKCISDIEKKGGFIGSFDLVIPMTESSLVEVRKHSKYSSVTIERWTVDEPQRLENDFNQTLDSYRKTRDIISEKIFQRFKNYFI